MFIITTNNLHAASVQRSIFMAFIIEAFQLQIQTVKSPANMRMQTQLDAIMSLW